MDVYIIDCITADFMGLRRKLMGHKTFISYKFSEAQSVRDKIISALGDDAKFYQGETSESPDLTDTTTENIKRNLANMLYDTSVTIVVISPNMRLSKWIPWEIQYSLCEYSRDGKASKTNGVLGVIMEINGNYDWFINNQVNHDGCKTITYNTQYLPNIIYNNMFNQTPKQYSCQYCKCVNRMSGHFITLVPMREFVFSPNIYIENAYKKAYENIDNYNISKEL